MQLMPEVADEMGVQDPFNARENVMGRRATAAELVESLQRQCESDAGGLQRRTRRGRPVPRQDAAFPRDAGLREARQLAAGREPQGWGLRRANVIEHWRVDYLEHRSRPAGFHQSDELLGNQWPAEVVALSLAAPLALKKRELLLRFHALRDDTMAEALAHADHSAD